MIIGKKTCPKNNLGPEKILSKNHLTFLNRLCIMST
nr:MAG TPA: hypothetical protein [Caudoviricetes sp.]